jgi:hypothetical protein
MAARGGIIGPPGTGGAGRAALWAQPARQANDRKVK